MPELQEHSAIQKSFACSAWTEEKKVILYECKGCDTAGGWKAKKRYSDFVKLRGQLVEKWPCIPVPLLPPKQILNKDQRFLDQRKHYLHRFLKKLAGFQYLIDSAEFKTFSRQDSQATSTLFRKSEPAPAKSMSLQQIFENLSIHLDIVDTDNMFDNQIADTIISNVGNERKVNDKEIDAFHTFANLKLKELAVLSAQVAVYMQNTIQEKKNMQLFFEMMASREDGYSEQFGDEGGAAFQYVLRGKAEELGDVGKEGGLMDQAQTVCGGLKNPYFNLFHWARGEIQDIRAILESIKRTNKMEERLIKLKKDLVKR